MFAVLSSMTSSYHVCAQSQLLLSFTSLFVVSLQQISVLALGTQSVSCIGAECLTKQRQDDTSNSRYQLDQPVGQRKASRECMYPCNCTRKQCKFGVNEVKDGCDCCMMCARQQGDLCNNRDKCDEQKGLYCDLKLDAGLRGICRARDAKPCVVRGKTYKDGEEFKPNCSQLCTCQNGRYACSSLCPQELRPPSTVHCRDAQLVSISGRCCREWVCPHTHSLIGPDDNFHNESPAPDDSSCKIETTQWSSCSQTCGLGVSIRMTGDKDCQPLQERRLCIVRPCDAEEANHHQPSGKERCRSMWQDDRKRRIQHPNGKCESVQELQLKYCSNTCKRRKCCGPGETDTRRVQFKCGPGHPPDLITEQMMEIRNCRCVKLKDCPFL